MRCLSLHSKTAVEVPGFSWSSSAGHERLESAETELDPHGQEIPLSGENRPTISLLEIGKGFSFKIISIPEDFRRSYCEDNGFIPGSIWYLDGMGPGKETVGVKKDSKYLAFTKDFAKKVKVRINKK